MRACPRRARLAQTQSGETRGTTSNRKCKSADSCRPFQACRCRRPGYSKNVVSAHNGRLGQINVNVPPRWISTYLALFWGPVGAREVLRRAGAHVPMSTHLLYLLWDAARGCWRAGGSPTGARHQLHQDGAPPSIASPPRVCSLCSHAVRACPRSARARR